MVFAIIWHGYDRFEIQCKFQGTHVNVIDKTDRIDTVGLFVMNMALVAEHGIKPSAINQSE